MSRARAFSTFCYLLVFVSLSLGLSACAASAAVPATPVAELTTTSIQMGWIHNYSMANFYAAAENGRFAANQLDVRMEEGGFGADGYIVPVDEVVSGELDFGVTSAASLIEARAVGKPVVAIAAIYQRNPTAILSLKDSNILRPKDLVGKRVAVIDSGAIDMFNAMLNLHHISPESVTIVPRTDYGVGQLLNGDVDALVAWVINEGVMLDEAGAAYNVMLLSDYGVDSYDTVLFTTNQMIAEHPETVQRFVQAALQGVQDVLDNPTQAVDYVLDYGTDLSHDAEYRRLQAMLPILKKPGSELGLMNADTWAFTQELLLDRGVLVMPINLSESFTNEFVTIAAGK